MVPSRQRPPRSWTEAIFFQHDNNNVQIARAARHDGDGGKRPRGTGSGHGWPDGWSMVPSWQRPVSGTEAIFFRGVLHPLGGARFFRHVNNGVQLVHGAWHKGGGVERHQQKVFT